jgi:hypothetical protein
MAKRKAKVRVRQARSKKPRTASQYLALSERRRESLVKAAHVLSTMRADGFSLRKASREYGISSQTVRRHAGSALRKTSRGTYKARASDTMLRVLALPTPDGLAEIGIRDSRSATIAGEYWNAVQTFLQTGDDADLRRFRGQAIIDAEGKIMPLLTDLDDLERLGAAGVLSFESLYARVG